MSWTKYVAYLCLILDLSPVADFCTSFRVSLHQVEAFLKANGGEDTSLTGEDKKAAEALLKAEPMQGF